MTTIPTTVATRLAENVSYVYEDGPSDGEYIDISDVNATKTMDCNLCLNELCLTEADYALYKSWVSVDTYEMVLITLNILVFLTGVIGNSLVVIAVTTTKSMQSVTNIFIVNLAIADVLVMLFCAPPSIIWDVTNTWVFGSLMCRIVIYIQDISVSVSVLTLTFIAYDRYHAICRPLHFATKKTRAFGVIGGIWLISAMIGIPDAVTLHLVSPFEDAPCRTGDVLFDLSSCSPSWSEEFDFFFTLLKAVLLYTLPLLFMSVAYYHIVRTLWTRSDLQEPHRCHHHSEEAVQPRVNVQNGVSSSSNVANSSGVRSATSMVLSRSHTLRSNNLHSSNIYRTNSSTLTSTQCNNCSGSTSGNCGNRGLDNQLRTRRKVAKMLIAVVIMFSINFFPVHLLPIVNYIVDHTLTPDSPSHEKISQMLMYAGIITHCMCYFNSAINPIIYYFMSAQFKAQYRRILSCRCFDYTPSPKAPRPVLETGPSPVIHAMVLGRQNDEEELGSRNRTENETAEGRSRSRSCLQVSTTNVQQTQIKAECDSNSPSKSRFNLSKFWKKNSNRNRKNRDEGESQNNANSIETAARTSNELRVPLTSEL